jgi:hypothetical protein
MRQRVTGSVDFDKLLAVPTVAELLEHPERIQDLPADGADPARRGAA